jgi:hypothetical protein
MGWCNHQQTGCEQVCLCAEAINSFLKKRSKYYLILNFFNAIAGESDITLMLYTLQYRMESTVYKIQYLLAGIFPAGR